MGSIESHSKLSSTMSTFCNLIAATFMVFGLVRSQEPTKCCAPDQWSAMMTDLASLSSPKMHILELQVDITQRKQAIVQRDVDTSTWQTTTTARTIQDFEKRMMFTIPEGAPTECYKFAYNSSMIKCIPDNATYLGSTYLGPVAGGLEYDGWKFQNAGTEMITIAMSKASCVPIVEA